MFVCVWNAVSILPELFSLLHIYNEVPGLQKKVVVRQSHGNAFSTLWAGWRAYIASRRTFLASFAYALLFWTALRYAHSGPRIPDVAMQLPSVAGT